MTASDSPGGRNLWLYAMLALVFIDCLWAGSRDFDPWVAQDEFRESIRSAIRWVIQLLIQLLIQYGVPGAIFLIFLRDFLSAQGRRNKH